MRRLLTGRRRRGGGTREGWHWHRLQAPHTCAKTVVMPMLICIAGGGVPRERGCRSMGA